ncbi:MAG: SDR family oxidoreductase [Chloroflexota bacterium]|nr:MAG: NAD(P)-dependent oxidoreductase [Chloroflexota bacterium]
MRILIIGATGLLGHRLFYELGRTDQVWGTVRASGVRLRNLPGVRPEQVIEGVDVLRPETVMQAVIESRPEVVINCAGLIKHRPEAEDPLLAIDVNSRFPHQLALICKLQGCRMIHISTDCVFSGKRGSYTEADATDATDLYGRSKALGEVVNQPHCLTIRTSFIGRELGTSYSLVEWFLSQSEQVKGFQKAIFSGLTTSGLARVLRDYILPKPELHGLYHVATEPISKYDLLLLLNEAFGKNMEIVPDDQVVIDRSLDYTKFREATGYQPPAWRKLVADLVSDQTIYTEEN